MTVGEFFSAVGEFLRALGQFFIELLKLLWETPIEDVIWAAVIIIGSIALIFYSLIGWIWLKEKYQEWKDNNSGGKN